MGREESTKRGMNFLKRLFRRKLTKEQKEVAEKYAMLIARATIFDKMGEKVPTDAAKFIEDNYPESIDFFEQSRERLCRKVMDGFGVDYYTASTWITATTT